MDEDRDEIDEYLDDKTFLLKKTQTTEEG